MAKETMRQKQERKQKEVMLASLYRKKLFGNFLWGTASSLTAVGILFMGLKDVDFARRASVAELQNRYYSCKIRNKGDDVGAYLVPAGIPNTLHNRKEVGRIISGINGSHSLDDLSHKEFIYALCPKY